MPKTISMSEAQVVEAMKEGRSFRYSPPGKVPVSEALQMLYAQACDELREERDTARQEETKLRRVWSKEFAGGMKKLVILPPEPRSFRTDTLLGMYACARYQRNGRLRSAWIALAHRFGAPGV